MPRTIQLPPARNATKAEEIQFLEAITANMPADTYLSSVFTPSFVQWIKYCITADTCPDIYAAMNAATQGKLDAQDEARKEHSQNRRLEENLESLTESTRYVASAELKVRQENEKLRDEARKERSQNRRLEENLEVELVRYNALKETAQNELDALKKRYNELYEMRNEAGEKLCNAMEENARLRQEIISLKARLFDQSEAETAKLFQPANA